MIPPDVVQNRVETKTVKELPHPSFAPYATENIIRENNFHEYLDAVNRACHDMVIMKLAKYSYFLLDFSFSWDLVDFLSELLFVSILVRRICPSPFLL